MIKEQFPKMSGLSAANLLLTTQFYTEYQANENLVPLVREIGWSEHVVISLITATLPIGVATYKTTHTFPAEYKALLPSAKAISQKLRHFLNENKNE